MLVVGLDPDRVDFSPIGYGAASEKGNTAAEAALANGRRTLEQRGYHVDLCMVVADEAAASELKRWLGRRSYDYVVFGAGLRCNPANTDLLTQLANPVHVTAPGVTLCFNAGAGDTAECVLRHTFRSQLPSRAKPLISGPQVVCPKVLQTVQKLSHPGFRQANCETTGH